MTSRYKPNPYTGVQVYPEEAYYLNPESRLQNQKQLILFRFIFSLFSHISFFTVSKHWQPLEEPTSEFIGKKNVTKCHQFIDEK